MLSKQLFVYVNDFNTSALYWFDTLTVKKWEIMTVINNDVLLFSAAKEETPYEQLLHQWETVTQLSELGLFPHKCIFHVISL